MKRQVFCIWGLAVIVFAAMMMAAEYAIPSETSERVIDLPKDSGKWFISIVGDKGDSQYQVITKWFASDKRLSNLRKQVHFWSVTSDSSAYIRYKSNVKGLPTIRVQRNDGSVVWEGSGKKIPNTPAGLYDTIAGATNAIFPVLPWRRSEPYLPILPLRDRPILPWRYNMENKCGPDGCPPPAPPDQNVDLTPAPPDDGGAPELAPDGPPAGLAVALVALCWIVGSVAGVAVQWRQATSGD